MQEFSMRSDEELRESSSNPGAENEIETACYLCYAQCVNRGNHGNGVRSCSKNVVAIVDREERLRRRAQKKLLGAG
jgi:hypothetical protein